MSNDHVEHLKDTLQSRYQDLSKALDEPGKMNVEAISQQIEGIRAVLTELEDAIAGSGKDRREYPQTKPPIRMLKPAYAPYDPHVSGPYDDSQS